MFETCVVSGTALIPFGSDAMPNLKLVPFRYGQHSVALLVLFYLRHDLGKGYVFQATEQCMRTEFVATSPG